VNPIVKDIADQFEDKLKMAKMNIDKYPSPVARWGVREVPHFLLLRDTGDPAEQIVGAVSKATLVSAIEKALL
jgi:thioredoxin 1